jgi:hypothetical protein
MKCPNDITSSPEPREGHFFCPPLGSCLASSRMKWAGGAAGRRTLDEPHQLGAAAPHARGLRERRQYAP